jgi:cytoskeletal protein RodZ
MKKLTTWAKSHKTAAIFAGTGALIVAGFVLIMALGIIFVSTGMVEPEPAAQEAEPAKAEKKPAKTAAPAKDEKAEAKPEKNTEVKAEPKAEKPKETKPSPKKAEPKKTTPPKPKADPLQGRLEATQKDLDVWFEECDWDNDKFNNGITDYATSVCASENLGIIVTTSDTAAEVFLTGAAEEAPIGKYFIDDGLAVWSVNGGTLNQAWDALGAPGYPKDMADLAK